MYKILENNLNYFDKNNNFGKGKYSIQTHSQAKTSGTNLLEVHGVQKGLDPNLRPEKQHTFPKQGKLERSQIGQGRAGSRRKKPDPINQTINQPSNMSQEIPGRTKIVTGKTNSIHCTNSTNDRLINNSPFMPLFLSILICSLDPQNNNPSNSILLKIYKKLTLTLILIWILKKTHHFKKASCWRHF